MRGSRGFESATCHAMFFLLLVSTCPALTPAEIIKKYGDAVVVITTYSAAEDAIGLGSGFIVDSSGIIITCRHVIAGAYPAVVKLLNGASFQDIRVLGADSANDIAIIKVKGRNLPTVKLSRSDNVEVGEPVIAVGNPKGLENTVSDGLLSGVREQDGSRSLQISAPISPGSSGGPVFNSSGLVIGVAAATLREGQNLNFCVPIQYARPLLAPANGVSLEEFSRESRPSEGPKAPSLAPATRSEFLHRFVPLLRLFWHMEWIARYPEEERKAGSAAVYMALQAEQWRRFLEESAVLSAPTDKLADIKATYDAIARLQLDGIDLAMQGVYRGDKAAQAQGLAKAVMATKEAKEGAPLLLRDLAMEYADDAGMQKEDIVRRLPAVFDSLPSIIVQNLLVAVVSEQPLIGYQRTGLGFFYYLDQPGVVVDSVIPRSQASQCGLRRGDVIVGVNDNDRVANVMAWWLFELRQPAGVTFSMNVLRNGARLTLGASMPSAR